MTKRTYVKPKVIYRRMDMFDSIAPGCEVKASFEEYGCPVDVPEWGLSFFGEVSCDYSTDDDNGMICYHVPTAGESIFSS